MSHRKSHLTNGVCECHCRKCTVVAPNGDEICICHQCDAWKCGLHGTSATTPE